MIAEHYSYECLTQRHGDCTGRCQFTASCNAECACGCHAKAITREDVPQKDQFIDGGDR